MKKKRELLLAAFIFALVLLVTSKLRPLLSSDTSPNSVSEDPNINTNWESRYGFHVDGKGAISASLINVTLREALDVVAFVGEKNIVTLEGLNGTVNLQLEGVNWGHALKQILDSLSLESYLDGNVIAVAPPSFFKEGDWHKNEQGYSGRFISIDFLDSKLQDALNVFTEITGVRYVASDEVRDKTISIRLIDVPADQAISLVFKMNGLTEVIGVDGTLVVLNKKN